MRYPSTPILVSPALGSAQAHALIAHLHYATGLAGLIVSLYAKLLKMVLLELAQCMLHEKRKIHFLTALPLFNCIKKNHPNRTELGVQTSWMNFAK